jgi:hypothetical protein
MLLRHLGQLSTAMRARFIKAGEALEGLTADEQLEVASQLAVAILKAARHRFEGSAGDRRAYDTLCAAVEEWFTTEIAPLRFARMQ